jgi:hypothetical protein
VPISLLKSAVSTIKDEKPVRERLFLATMAVFRIFAEVSLRNENFGEFVSSGRYNEHTQKYFLGLIGKEIEENIGDFSASLAAYCPSLNSETLLPFMTKTGVPNIFSNFHLVFQSFRQDFVCPSLYIANWQPALRADVVDKTCHLSDGFLSELSSVDDDMSYLILSNVDWEAMA